jgi:N-acetyl-anhydromuramyl-L-alanine amidase AmpD
MSITLSGLKLFILLIAIAASTASCQDANRPKFRSAKDPQSDFAKVQVGQGAVASQDNLRPWSSKEVSSCTIRIKMPAEEQQLADPSNYGNRDSRDYLGRKLASQPRFVVIHETVLGEKDTISLFKTNHPNDSNQVSYHMLIARDGRLIRVVPDGHRAYGAGMSHFMGSTLRAKKNSAGSLNNVGLHISLVSPAGFEYSDSHTGYTSAQYSSLAKQILKWQMQYGIPMARVTTHYAVDRSHSRYDPRSYHWDKFDDVHGELTDTCMVPQLAQPLT